MRVIVLGGRGFVGRHVVAALVRQGIDVVIGSRRPSGLGGAYGCVVRQARLERLTTAAAWEPLLVDVDVVVNCVGILRERRGETFDAIHHRAPAALADACVAAGIAKLIHVSALGLVATASDGFLVSKGAGERALARAMLDVTIVRPSLLDGEGGFGARWLRALARLPIHFVPARAVGAIAVLAVDDLGLAIARLCLAPIRRGLHEAELGGAEARTLAEHLQALRRLRTDRPAWMIRIPHGVSLLVARFCDALHFSPYSVGHLELLGRANVPRTNALASLLGRAPTRVGVASAAGPASASRDGVPGLRRPDQSRTGAPSGKYGRNGRASSTSRANVGRASSRAR